jgi:biotin operon repressor
VTELEVIEEVFEGEIVEAELVPEVEPLTEKEARALDKRIRSASDKVTANANLLIELLDQASQGQIHEALGYSSWTAYVKDAAQISITDKIERKSFVSLMSGKGMSQRAIGGVLGVSRQTVNNDLAEVGDDSGLVIGLDGKPYSKSKKKTKVVDPEPVDEEESEFVDAEPEEYEEAPAKATPISDEYRNEIYNLVNASAVLHDLIYNDERFPKARGRLAKLKITDDLRAVSENLEIYLTVINGAEEEE